MKKLATIALLTVAALGHPAFAKKIPFYVGSYNASWGQPNQDGITYGELETNDNSITPLTLAASTPNPSYFIVNDNFVYVVNEIDAGTISTFKRDGNKLIPTYQNNAYGSNPVFISQHGDDLFTANYGTANNANSGVSAFNNSNDSITMTDTQSYSQADGSHAHSVYPVMIDGKYMVYSADLGTDLIHVYHYDQGQLVPVQNLQLADGTGPRHMAFSTEHNHVYITDELNSTITILNIDTTTGKASVSGTIKSYQGELKADRNYPSAITLTDEGRRLYVTNRGMNNITLFDVNNDGSLSFNSAYDTHGDWPRDLDITRDGQYMAVTNQNSNNISFFLIDKNSGHLIFLNTVSVHAPATVKFI